MEPKYAPPRCGFEVLEDGRFKASCDKVGRISGTMMAGILGCSPWSSEFTVACELLGLGVEDISDKPAVRTGQALEGRIIEYAGKAHPDLGTFVPAEEIFGAREGAHADWAPDFEDEDFTGHVDGIVIGPDGRDCVLEIKTSANDKAWEDGVPEYYFWQVALYDRFVARRGFAYVVRGKVDQQAYADPESWEPSDDNVVMYRLELDPEKVEEGVRRAKEWRESLKESLTTPVPDMSRPADRCLADHLMGLVSCERSFEDIVEEYGYVRRQKKAVEDEYQWLTDKEERLKGLIRNHMERSDMSEADSKSGRFTVRLSKSTRKTLDQSLLEKAGIDPAPYLKETVYTTVRMTENKERDIWQ